MYMYGKHRLLTYSSAHCVEWEVQALVVGILRGIANCVTDKVSERCSSTSNHCDTDSVSEASCSSHPTWAANTSKGIHAPTVNEEACWAAVLS